MTRPILIAFAIALVLSGCNNKQVRNEPPPRYYEPPPREEPPPQPSEACRSAKGKLDDFGPGVERCRKQNAEDLDDLGPRR